jgi:Mn-dependent DtxR family transcriptional regulator
MVTAKSLAKKMAYKKPLTLVEARRLREAGWIKKSSKGNLAVLTSKGRKRIKLLKEVGYI